ncbi:MAG: hypothetical protein BSR46_00370 [Candidatus Dactylopiibacterium carminicum]|nr:RDD family protein [Candidatus Dactylopiibacterium carminicum]PAT00847.1 MAG: hypothetical protein BSR46_00370 [Candidatus Dactylopiibacterium carminicum]
MSTRSVVELASLRRRLACLLYESLLLLGIFAAGFLLPQVIFGMLANLALPGWVLWLHLFVLFGIYFVWLWRRNGQTLAMQTWQLQLVTQEGKPPTLAQCLLRYALAWPAMLLLGSGLGLIWTAFIDRDRQFPHDRLAGTRIVFNPRAPGSRLSVRSKSVAGGVKPAAGRRKQAREPRSRLRGKTINSCQT